MERMSAPLTEVVTILLDSHQKANGRVLKIPMGDVATAMLDCITALHEQGYVFVDVKTENFMLSGTSAASSKKIKKASNNSVGERVRLIDFGLVEMNNDMSSSKHRENAHPDAPLVGTPTYASLNVMGGHTASRRDDLESLGYVLSELVLMLAGKKRNGHNVLPWSNATSDDELHRMKAQEMDKNKRSRSKLFTGFKSAGVDATMGNYFAAVRSLKYAEKPDYQNLRNCLKNLTVTVESGAKKATTNTTKAANTRREFDSSDDDVSFVDENVENRKSTGKKKTSSTASKKSPKKPASRRARRKHDDSDDDSIEVVEAGKKQKVSVGSESVVRRSARSHKNPNKTRDMGTQTDEMEVVDVESTGDENTMEWEAIDSDGSSDVDVKGILKLDVIEGPHTGQEVTFGGDLPDTLLIGGDPASRAMKDATKFALSEDDAASDVLAKLVLTSKKNMHSVRVTEMSSSNGVLVKGSSLPKGKGRQAFVGDTIKIGVSLLQIRKV
ncbi:hypothetical protein ACHAWF_015961 [Thalassiosira exigua]